MNADITSDTDRHGQEVVGGQVRRWGPRARFVFRILGILLAAVLMLVLLGLLFSPRSWRF